MPNLTYTSSEVYNQFFAPVLKLKNLLCSRRCPVLSDLNWLLFGILRVLHQVASGREFLQLLASQLDQDLERSHFFETLKSKRRLSLVSEAAESLSQSMAELMPDPFRALGELENFELFAGDGHWHAHASHDAKKLRPQGESASKKAKFAVGHLYGINLRSRALVHLAHCDELTRKKEHDMHVLKRLDTEMLRQGAPKGKKVLWVWDRAAVDFRQWYNWKRSKGIYFLSRAKKNMKLNGPENRWDRDDAVNHGVVSDRLLSETGGAMLRCVIYQDPVSGERFEFLTNELTLRPGVIVQLYRMRWDIEKAFDDFKTKLGELKAWASSTCAKSMQAQFICLAHNLLVLYEEHLRQDHDLSNVAEDERRQKRLKGEISKAAEKGRPLPALYIQLNRATQVPVKLIRWIRIHLFSPTSWQRAEADLRRRYARL